jgi:hypothetical protein
MSIVNTKFYSYGTWKNCRKSLFHIPGLFLLSLTLLLSNKLRKLLYEPDLYPQASETLKFAIQLTCRNIYSTQEAGFWKLALCLHLTSPTTNTTFVPMSSALWTSEGGRGYKNSKDVLEVSTQKLECVLA